MKRPNRKRSAVAVLGALVLTACSNSGDGTGSVSVSLMDRPVDGIAELWLTITEIWAKPAGDGPAIPLTMTESPIHVNLLALGDENAAVLVDQDIVGAGDYNWIEFHVDDSDVGLSYAITDIGGQEPVDIDVPSGRVRLVSGFTVGENQAVRLLFDWDVRKGLTDPVGRDGYLLRPAFRILDVDELGIVSGNIAQDRFDAEPTCTSKSDADIGNVVYVFAGTEPADDIDGNAPDPITTVDAVPSTSGGYDYRVALMPGEYTLAFTCEGADDTDAGDETLVFLSPTVPQPVAVGLSADVTDVNF